MVRPKSKAVLLDGRGHLMGRMASVIAKQLLQGKHITVVRCEQINISGPFIRNKKRKLRWLRKRTLTNPQRGPLHFRAPSEMFKRVVRGMVPYQTVRGAAAFRRLTTYDGVPAPHDRKKRMVCPRALRFLRLAPERKYCLLGRLSHELGWKYRDVVARLENKRKERAATFHETKTKTNGVLAKAKNKVDANAAKLMGKDNA
eukprot:323514_1